MMRRTPFVVLALLVMLSLAPSASALDRRIAVYCDNLDDTPRCGYNDTGRAGDCIPVTNFVGVCADADGQVLVGVALYGMEPPCSHPDNCSGGHVGGDVVGCGLIVRVTQETPREDHVRDLDVRVPLMPQLMDRCPL